MSEESNKTPGWLVYERCVATMMAEEHGDQDSTVMPNASLIGELSGVRRQIDVLIERRWEALGISRIIVDAKNRSRPVDIKDVEEFEGMMKDCRAARGIIVCTGGWTDAAKRRSQDAIDIELLTFDEALEFEWRYEPCFGRCIPQSGGRGGVMWSDWLTVGCDSPGWVFISISKCDGCHSFHVWCMDCGGKFAIPDGQVETCGCDGKEWASMLESKESGHTGRPESIWLMMRENGGPPIALDRKPIR